MKKPTLIKTLDVATMEVKGKNRRVAVVFLSDLLALEREVKDLRRSINEKY